MLILQINPPDLKYLWNIIFLNLYLEILVLDQM